jgi:hypothetical protein
MATGQSCNGYYGLVLTLGLVTDPVWRVLFGELVDLVILLIGQVDVCANLSVKSNQTELCWLTLHVGLNPVVGHTLGDHTNTPLQQPAEEDRRTLHFVLLGDGKDDFVLAEVVAVGPAERGERLGEDVVLLEPFNELDLRALKGQLDLVCKRC